MAKIALRVAEHNQIRESLDYGEYIEYLRGLREKECFDIINRGQLWYDSLTDSQKNELRYWYRAWLDVTMTGDIPQKPVWLK